MRKVCKRGMQEEEEEEEERSYRDYYALPNRTQSSFSSIPASG
jgi:hypothetical protein